MAEGSGIVEKAKLPFANYDIVVYFGVGICSLPFVFRYVLSTSENKFPAIFNGYNDPLINSIVSIVALIFGVYIIGHGIALVASIVVEQFVYRSMGTPSSVIARNASPTISGQPYETRNAIIQQLRETYGTNSSPADIIRLIIHLPALPVYILMYALRVFGFYESKVSGFVVLRVQKRLEKSFDYSGSILNDHNWFKIVEYACANDHPVAMPKMYNYLMIYGLFRSMSLLVIMSLWAEIFYYFWSGGIGFLDIGGHGSMIVRLIVLYISYFITLVGFAKFSRRYSEEAIQAFALSKSFE